MNLHVSEVNYQTAVFARGRIRREGGSEDLLPYSIGHYLGILYNRANVAVEHFSKMSHIITH
jgi:hypothetical protein